MEDSMQSISKRKLMTGGAALAVAGATLATLPAEAANDDAELVHLWEQYKAQRHRCNELYKAFGEIEERVWTPSWTFESVEFFGGEFKACFVSRVEGEPQRQYFSLATNNFSEASRLAQAKAEALQLEHNRLVVTPCLY
jgi:hypothetical protein